MAKKKKPKKNKIPPQPPKRRKSLPKEAKELMLELDSVVYINHEEGCASKLCISYYFILCLIPVPATVGAFCKRPIN